MSLLNFLNSHPHWGFQGMFAPVESSSPSSAGDDSGSGYWYHRSQFSGHEAPVQTHETRTRDIGGRVPFPPPTLRNSAVSKERTNRDPLSISQWSAVSGTAIFRSKLMECLSLGASGTKGSGRVSNSSAVHDDNT